MGIQNVLICTVGFLALTDIVWSYHHPAPNIKTGIFTFHYDPAKGIFIGQNKFTCILVSLNKTERHDVHTVNGIQRIELQMMKDWMGVLPEVMVYRTDPMLSNNIHHWCENRNIIMLLRNKEKTTVTSATVSTRPAIGPVSSRTKLTFSGTSTISQTTRAVHYQTSTGNNQSENNSSPSIGDRSTTGTQSVTSRQQTTKTPLPSTNYYPLPTRIQQTENSHSTVYFPSPTKSQSTNFKPSPSRFTIVSTKLVPTVPAATVSGQNISQSSAMTTTTEFPASATSHHTVRVTTSSAVGPYIIYDTFSSQVNAVIVDDGACYIYHLTDVDVKLVNMGKDIKEAFERALLSKDRSKAIKYSRYVFGKNDLIRRACTGDVFLLT